MKLLYKVLLATLPVASFTACNKENVQPSNPTQQHYATVYMDWDKFKYQRGEENPAFIDLENQINYALSRSQETNRIVIKSKNKEDITTKLTAREWGMGYRNPLQALVDKYLTQNHPIQIAVNDTLDVYNKNLPLLATDSVGIRTDDVRALKNKGVVFREISRDTVMMQLSH